MVGYRLHVFFFLEIYVAKEKLDIYYYLAIIISSKVCLQSNSWLEMFIQKKMIVAYFCMFHFKFQRVISQRILIRWNLRWIQGTRLIKFFSKIHGTIFSNLNSIWWDTFGSFLKRPCPEQSWFWIVLAINSIDLLKKDTFYCALFTFLPLWNASLLSLGNLDFRIPETSCQELIENCP